MNLIVIHASSSFYEILLIILVLVLIFNGILRRKVLKKMSESMEKPDKIRKSIDVNLHSKSAASNDEYVDYEIINE